jgi:hypothetical protein
MKLNPINTGGALFLAPTQAQTRLKQRSSLTMLRTLSTMIIPIARDAPQTGVS